MAYTNETKNLKLPQWVSDDHPDFLTDINEAFRTIDDNAGATAGELDGLPDRVDQLSTVVQSHGEDIGTLQGDVTAVQVEVGNIKENSNQVPGLKTAVEGLQAWQEGVNPKIANNSEYVNFATKRIVDGIVTAVSELDETKSFNYQFERDGNILLSYPSTTYYPASNSAAEVYKVSAEDTSRLFTALHISVEKQVHVISISPGIIVKNVDGKHVVVGYVFMGYDTNKNQITFDVRIMENISANTVITLFSPRSIFMEV